MQYEHGSHAANQGDVWKHVILWEVLASRLSERSEGSTAFIYAETHAGRAQYPDRAQLPEYDVGFGRFRGRSGWTVRSDYFRVESAAGGYLGSSALAHRLVTEARAPSSLHLWDDSHDVADALAGFFAGAAGASVHVRCEDGYAGLRDSGLVPDFLLVDPPCADWRRILRVYRERTIMTATLAWYPLHSSFVGRTGHPAPSKRASSFAQKVRQPVFQVQWLPAHRNTRVMIGCGVAVGGASALCLAKLDQLLPAVAEELAAGQVDAPYRRAG